MKLEMLKRVYKAHTVQQIIQHVPPLKKPHTPNNLF